MSESRVPVLEQGKSITNLGGAKSRASISFFLTRAYKFFTTITLGGLPVNPI